MLFVARPGETRAALADRFVPIALDGASALMLGTLAVTVIAGDVFTLCSVGALNNVGTWSWSNADGVIWWLASLTGLLIAAVWNFVGSSEFGWSRS